MMPPRMLTPMCSFSAPVALPPHAVIELEDRRSVDELTQDALVIPLRYEPFQNDSNRWSDTTMFTFRSHVRSNSHRLPAIAETSPSPAWHSQVTLHETEEPMNWEGFLIAHPIPPHLVHDQRRRRTLFPCGERLRRPKDSWTRGLGGEAVEDYCVSGDGRGFVSHRPLVLITSKS